MMATVPHVISGLGLKKISGRRIFVDTSVRNIVTLTYQFRSQTPHIFTYKQTDPRNTLIQ